MTKGVIKKLDSRNTGYGIWKYYVNQRKSDLKLKKTLNELRQEYYLWREWCWEVWGPSKELIYWLNDNQYNINLSSQNQHWCWLNNDIATRIYLKGDEELTMFILRWNTALYLDKM